ncbi:MAG: hypothetical protein KGL53_01690, partial [Elusimicrobia bacterium]|nr:hypothetical protein [Elusimicrobiota bacterium]
LKAWAKAAGADGLDEALAADLRAGALSSRLKPLLERYLADEAQVERGLAAQEALERLGRDREARRAFADLRAAAPKLAGEDGLSKRLQAILDAPDEGAGARLSAGDLHERSASGAALEPGDEAVFSAAYWVDGLPSGRKAPVDEVLVLDLGGRGLRVAARDRDRRRDGGPYTVSFKAVVPESGLLRYRLILDAEGGSRLELSTATAVSGGLDDLRARAADAQALALSCRLDESTAAWTDVLADLKDPATPARRGLASAARKGLAQARAWADRARELKLSMDGARLYATPDHCDYDTSRAKRSLELLAGLPAGCDAGTADELRTLMRQTDSRRRLQEAFEDAVSRAREREASCKPDAAAGLYASALALLDTDPGARCGPYEQQYAAVRLSDLPRAASAQGLGAALDAELGKAETLFKSGDSAGASAILLPLTTSLRRLPDARCREQALRKADDLTAAAGVALA